MADPNEITFMIIRALFMLLLISEGVHHHHHHHHYYYYYYFRSNHLIGPSSILLEHGAFPNIETCFAMPPPRPQEKNLSTMNILVHSH
jgi:hypothetical protein